MSAELERSGLLEIIRAQNEIATSALDLDAVMQLVVQRARVLTGADASVVELAEGEEMVYHVVAGTAVGYAGVRLRIDSSLSGLCVQLGETLHCRDASRDDRVDLDACRRVGAMSMVCVPLSHDDRVIGVLKVYDRQLDAFSGQDVATLDLLAGIIAAQMAHANSFQEHLHDSRHDPLTGLMNRRALEERLAMELARSERHGGGLTVCLLDLDRFKQVNDTHGHAAGDAVLQAVAAQLSHLRGEDGAFRLGGDELALVLIEASEEDASSVMGRLATSIELDPDCLGVGVSWGVATFEPGDTQATILARADQGVYGAKVRLR